MEIVNVDNIPLDFWFCYVIMVLEKEEVETPIFQDLIRTPFNHKWFDRSQSNYRKTSKFLIIELYCFAIQLEDT